ncbi:MAG: tRNA (adenosine(37)-N6)-threonylcarbamoyltransferase complex transferase subunit TsaD [Planctomycetota bacterium]
MDAPVVLGIESSCDETAVAVVRGRRVVSSVVASQHELHAEYGGVVPELASRAHVERLIPTLREALAGAGMGLDEIEAVAVGHRPGLIGSLLVGLSAAKGLAWSLGVPLVGVDHVRAHLLAPLLVDAGCDAGGIGQDVGGDGGDVWPALGLVVSGGHTSLYRMDGFSSMTRVGATIDDAIGEAFDKVASMLGVAHPGGPNLEKLAADGDAAAFSFPVSLLGKGSLDFSFSGLKTAVLYEVRGKPAPRAIPGKPAIERAPAPELTDRRRADLAASFQAAAVRAVEKKLGRALDRFGDVRTVLVGGGVSANAALREAVGRAVGGAAGRWGEGREIRVRLSAPSYCGDNAAMIAGLGAELLASSSVRALEASGEAGLGLAAVPTTAV